MRWLQRRPCPARAERAAATPQTPPPSWQPTDTASLATETRARGRARGGDKRRAANRRRGRGPASRARVCAAAPSGVACGSPALSSLPGPEGVVVRVSSGERVAAGVVQGRRVGIVGGTTEACGVRAGGLGGRPDPQTPRSPRLLGGSLPLRARAGPSRSLPRPVPAPARAPACGAAGFGHSLSSRRRPGRSPYLSR